MYLYSVFATFAFAWGLYGVLIVSCSFHPPPRYNILPDKRSLLKKANNWRKNNRDTGYPTLFLLFRSFVRYLQLTLSLFLFDNRTTQRLWGGTHWHMWSTWLSTLSRQSSWQWPGSWLGTIFWANLNRTKQETQQPHPSPTTCDRTFNSRAASPSSSSSPSGAFTYVFSLLWCLMDLCSFLSILFSNLLSRLLFMRHIAVLCVSGVVVLVLADPPVRSSFQHGRWRHELGIRFDTYDVPPQDRTGSRKAHCPPQRGRRRIYLIYPPFAFRHYNIYLIINCIPPLLSHSHSTLLKAKVFGREFLC